MFLRLLLLSFVFVLVGCESVLDESDFLKVAGEERRLTNRRDYGLITASIDGGDFTDVLRFLPADISVCVSESVRFKRFSVDVYEVDVETFLYAVCRSLKCTLQVYDRLYVFDDSGKSSDDKTSGSADRKMGLLSGSTSEGSYCVFMSIPYYKREEVRDVLSSSGCSVISVSGDWYLMKGDVGSVVKARRLVDEMLLHLPCEYAFELWLIQRDYMVDVDLGLSLNGNGGLSFARMAGELSKTEWNYVLNVVSSCSLNRTKSDYVRHIAGVFREGVDYKVSVGDSVPYVKRAVVESGAAVDTGLEYVDYGFTLVVGCSGSTAGVCNIDLQMNDVGGYVNGYPVKHGSTLKSEFYVSGDNRRYVGSFLSDGYSTSIFGKSVKRSEWMVFCRVLRVGAGQKVEFLSKK